MGLLNTSRDHKSHQTKASFDIPLAVSQGADRLLESSCNLKSIAMTDCAQQTWSQDISMFVLIVATSDWVVYHCITRAALQAIWTKMLMSALRLSAP